VDGCLPSQSLQTAVGKDPGSVNPYWLGYFMTYDIAFALNQGIVVAMLTAMNSIAFLTTT
jgi:hypothetical protein